MVYLSRADLTKKARKLESLESWKAGKKKRDNCSLASGQVKTTGALGYIILLLVFFVPGITTTWNLEYTGHWTTKTNTSKYLYIVISTK